MTHLHLELSGDAVATTATGIVKLSCDLGGKPTEGPGLTRRGEAGMELFALGSDWVAPRRDEVIVIGDAVAPVNDASESEVRCTVGATSKRIAVFGRRLASLDGDGRVVFSAPEPFTRIALSNANAYGGVDGRVPVPPPRDPYEVARLLAAYPGMYPRNPIGKGYVVLRQAVEGVELPNLEDPADLLVPQRFVVESPDLWWRMPLPATLGFRDVAMFPRLMPLGCTPWFDAPEDEQLEEVRRGILPSGYRSRPDLLTRDMFATAASLDLSFRELAPTTPISVWGVRERQAKLELRVPAPPSVAFELDGGVLPAIRRSSRYVVQVNEERLDVIHHVEAELPRAFLPGIHKYVALRMRVEGVGTIEYVPPPTIHEALVEAGLRPRDAGPSPVATGGGR